MANQSNHESTESSFSAFQFLIFWISNSIYDKSCFIEIFENRQWLDFHARIQKARIIRPITADFKISNLQNRHFHLRLTDLILAFGYKILLKNKANRPQRPSVLRSALQKQEKSVDNDSPRPALPCFSGRAALPGF